MAPDLVITKTDSADPVASGESFDYTIEVRWRAKSPPLYWKPPRATQTDGSDLCRGLDCEGRNHCVNVASRPRRIELESDHTDYTLRVACICVPD